MARALSNDERNELEERRDRAELARLRAQQGNADFNHELRQAITAAVKRRDTPVAPRELERWHIVRAYRRDIRDGSLLYGETTGRQRRAGSVPSVAKRLGVTKTDLMRARHRLGLEDWPPTDD